MGDGAHVSRRTRRSRRVRRRRRVAAAILGAIALAAAALVVASLPAGGRVGTKRLASLGSHLTKKHPARAPEHRTAAHGPIFLGPDGVESEAIIAENRRPGTTAWRITDAPSTGMIEGFADRSAVTAGQSFGLYVSTTAPSFHVVAYRMGWYQGKGARRVWWSRRFVGRDQGSCPVDHDTNTVSCDNWRPSMTIGVDSAWTPGDYVLKLTGSGNEQSYVLLTVWDPASHAAYLVVNRTLTEEGWNTFGGYDFYQGLGSCILDDQTYPPCNRARVVSLDRPYAEDNGAEDFFVNEYPLISWMEEQGLDVTYVTDITLSQHPDLALRHRAWLSLDHDETWTWSELQGARAAMAHGVNVLFFSGAGIVRHCRLQASPLGPDREVVDYRDAAEDPEAVSGSPDLVTGNTWDAADSALTGEQYSGYVLPSAPQAPMEVYDAAPWLVAGTGLRDGSEIPDAIGSDIDHLDPGSGLEPADLQVLAHSPIPLTEAFSGQGAWSGDTYSDFTYYADPHSGAGVIDTGDTTFIQDLTQCTPGSITCPRATLLRLAGNMLRLFGRGPAGRIDPPQPNWQTVEPAGS